MIDALILGTAGVALAALWWAAGIIGTRARLEREDAELLARAAAQPVERTRKCPRCSGTRCHFWGTLGALCPPQRGPGLRGAFGPASGRHEPSSVFRRAVAKNWRPPLARLYTLRQRIGALPPAGVLP